VSNCANASRPGERFAKNQSRTTSVRRHASLSFEGTRLTLDLQGHIGRQGVGDTIFLDAGDPSPGPFANLTAFHDFYARYACRSHPEWNPRRDFPELAGLTDDRSVVFTHADLCMRNIMVSSPDEGNSGLTPTVLAVLDWHQSGWYPADWEWLKAQGMCEPLGGGRRDTAWLERVVPRADEGYAYAWEYVTNCLGWG